MAAALWLLSVTIEYVAPVLIWPIFYNLRPLDNPDLTRRFTLLLARASLSVLGVYTMNISRRFTTANAWLVGLGRTRRIVLSDTLVSDLMPDEIEFVLAHELAHSS